MNKKRRLQELFGDLEEQVEAYVNKPKVKRRKIQKPKEDEKEE
jgi:spore coat protein W